MYCGLFLAALVHLYQKVRGNRGMWSFLAYALPSSLLLLAGIAVMVCLVNLNAVALSAKEPPDLGRLAIFYKSGRQAVYGGGPSPLFHFAVLTLVNTPFWFMLAVKSWHRSLGSTCRQTGPSC